MTSPLVGQYQPGDTLLHRMPVWIKIAGLGIWSIAIVSIRNLPWALACLLFALVLTGVARLRWRSAARQVRGVLIVAVAVAGFQWWLFGAARAVESLADLVSLALLALVVMTTTEVNALLDAVTRGLRRVPFVDADRVALLFALSMHALPESVELAQETRDAVAARGLGRNPRHYLAPYVVRVVARAQQTGDALAARGLGD
ncbi:energy-coupling factor transporter transmembrane component T family protein [Propionicicella superfundia]|uniref:energy-coupling factor transporter transmembrane component T family protein n=1 Tax=Propionicicella superfundia TaxID=348582 RepID=UPI0004165947|nr:energy-coupling factor transporter transmembrane protein EcfT [Propionicicella superfundia]